MREMDITIGELLSTLHRLSGMWVSLYNGSFHGYPCSIDQESCPSLCDRLHRAGENNRSRCFASDVAARRHCDRCGEAVGYLCPFGLYEILVPIRDGSATVGYIFLGKSLPVGADAEERLRAALAPFPALTQDPEALSKLIAQLPRHTPEEYAALCRTASVFADRIAEEGFPDSASLPLAQLICRYLHKHYGEPVTLAALGLYFHCSTVTLTESFRKEYGETIMRRLERIRMDRARELLERTGASVGEIAERCGYSDVGYFSKRFHKTYGASPSGWRAVHSVSVSL